MAQGNQSPTVGQWSSDVVEEDDEDDDEVDNESDDAEELPVLLLRELASEDVLIEVAVTVTVWFAVCVTAGSSEQYWLATAAFWSKHRTMRLLQTAGRMM